RNQLQVRRAQPRRAFRRRGTQARILEDGYRAPVRPGGRSAGVTRLTRGALEAHLAERVFSAPPLATLTPRRVGAEIELLALDAQTDRTCAPTGAGTTPCLP